jgi:DNA gyrase/topoisomerase IV subunit B
VGQTFDLNVEKVLEHWTPAHALREVIANALDEHALIGRADRPLVAKDDAGIWHVQDQGRGLRYHHLTQNESDEKRASDVVVGQFGVGLKDALATFHRNGIEVRIVAARHDLARRARQARLR